MKYLITAAQRERFLSAAKSGLQEDPHGRSAVYRVSSQYYDSANLSAYWEKLDGEAVRKKFRLRYYSTDESDNPRVSAAFMEIKHRIDHTVYKERVRLTDDGANDILSDARALVELDKFVVEKDQSKQSTINAIKRAAQSHGFSAVNVISYLREAWEGLVDRRLRLTFDASCQALAPDAYLDVNANRGRHIIPADMVVMEIKFDHAIPRWMRDIAVAQGPRLQRFSKYAAGTEAIWSDNGKLTRKLIHEA